MTLTEKIAAVQVETHQHDQYCGLGEGRCEVLYGRRDMVRMSPFVRALNEKRLTPKVLYNGSWTPEGDGGAA